ncbi:glucose-6-phosphate isomerase [Leucobacter triazinivorans]|uniref:Glucose-6-phosphate isomerase n=1 Tax=Leucobacter triazinivorans TaxID=1784719 RepID=A0A4P6KBB2_9MICO|nr:glucose-6-phosphate isomerase [Leucobacter triazinivorans]QBE47566.1 glucose-6-phosphate isomerase [Leucobacter triazinivorans]
MSVQLSIGSGIASFDEPLQRLVSERVAGRIFERDAALWGRPAEPEAAIRLGWTDFIRTAEQLIPRIDGLRAELLSQGVDRFVLCGMGGSSLAPAVITRWAGVELTMIDSTHPDAVRRVLDPEALARTAVVVSSKSGSTIETRSHLAAFTEAFRGAGIDPADRIVIVTDPGSPLDGESRAAGRRVFTADPHVGGRFSALTAFGLVPAGLAGADLRTLVADAQRVRASLASDTTENPALRLAAAISAGLPERFVLAVSEVDGSDWGFGAWIEQLVAESTGKEGRGVLPIALPVSSAEFATPPDNTLRVRTGADLPSSDGDWELATAGALGAQILTWEVATAALGRIMGIDPFDQPDVEAAKVAARAALGAPSEERGTSVDPPAPVRLAEQVRGAVPRGGYLAIQAYVDPAGRCAAALRRLRERLAAALGVPVALGFGPSYLHSVGQLHKGGPALGAFLQVIEVADRDLMIPGGESSFGALIAAQARGDRDVLRERGRPVLVLALAGPNDSSLDEFLAAL